MSVYEKLAKFKETVTCVAKKSDNPFFKSKYFDINDLLEVVEPELKNCGLLLLQPIIDGSICTQIIDTDTGEKVESNFTLPLITDPQKMGSCVTYYRRYSLQSMLCLQAVDDDGNMASNRDEKRALEDVNRCSSVQELTNVYNQYATLHNNKNFIDTAKRKKEQLTKEA